MAELLHRAGALHAALRFRRVSPGPTVVSILTYHHVADEEVAYPYDPGVADATPAQFRRQLELLARYGTPIGIDELVRAFEGAPLPKNPVMVTFDDGYRSCHDVALPILRAVGMRATFFVPTAFVGERRLYWWERVAVALSQARTAHASLAYPYPFEVNTRDPGAQRVLTDVIKNTPSLDVERFLAGLCDAFGVEWNHEIEAQHADNVVMTWDHLRALVRAGMDVESHSRRHRVLQTLDNDELFDELAGSRAELEAQLGRPIRAIAYPVGRRVAHQARIREAVAAAGYRVGLSNASGTTRLWSGVLRELWPADPYDVKRLSTDREMSDAMWLAQVAMPQFAYIGRHGS
ncbi:MAG TPA: polysaccharide deacetylase family protein [Kofleriaceae bacterium]|nr:polysaccharide deacetylase family protein [Kofleriaceae bacterium]